MLPSTGTGGTVMLGMPNIAPEAERRRRIDPAFWLPASTILVGAYNQAAIGVVLGVVETRWHLSPGQVSVLATAEVGGMLLGSPLAGLVADRFGRRRVFLADLGVFVLAALASGLAPGFATLVVARLVLGLAVGADYTVSLVYLAESAPSHRRGRWMAAGLWGANLGMLSAYGLGAVLLRASWGWRGVLVAGALLALPGYAARRRVAESPAFHRSPHRGASAITIARHGVSGANLRRQVVPMLAAFSYQTGDQGLTLFLPVILAEVLTAKAAGGATAALAVKALTIPASLATVFLVDRLGRRRLQVGGFALRGLALATVAAGIAMSWLGPLAVAALLALALAAGASGPDKTTAIVPTEVVGDGTRGIGQGLTQATGRLGGMVGPVGYVFLAHAFGLGAGLAWFACFSLFGGFVSRYLPETSGVELDVIT